VRSNLLSRNLTKKYAIDFGLVPVAIVLIEFSVFIIQVSSETYSSLSDLVILRLIHTGLMLMTSYLVSQTYIYFKKTEVEYRTLAITGILVMAFGDLTHSILASNFDIELVSLYRRIGFVLIQGGLWFPAFIFIGGNRKEILNQFKAYENRLIVATRARSRTSNEFKDEQKNIQDRIQTELYAACVVMKESITKQVSSGISLVQQYAAVQPVLVGDDLRKLSRELEGSAAGDTSQILVDKKSNRVRFFIQEFRHLHASITRNAPLRANAYSIVLIALATPLFINYYSFTEFLLTYPIFIISVLVLSKLIVRAQAGGSPTALRNGSILVFITGLFPHLFSLAGQAINHGPDAPFPLLVSAIALPITYYFCMAAFQVLRPSALSLVRNDELIASDALQSKVRRVVRDDFTQYLNQQWAVYIHGKILTRLASTSLKLQSSSSASDSRTYSATLESLYSLLSHPDADFEAVSADLEAEVTSRLAPWRGLLEINIHIDEQLKSLRNARVKNIGEVIEELVSNSIRHGKAKKIDLRVTRSEGSDIEIIAIDNAIIPPANPPLKFGLGTRIFNLVSDGRWSITRVGLFTEFKLLVALE
jgi:hypothetical protein